MNRAWVLAKSATGAIRDPSRQDLVAAVVELMASTSTLRTLHRKMLSSPDGRYLLRNQPRINSQELSVFSEQHKFGPKTLGYHYNSFMQREGISPDTRSQVRYIGNGESEFGYVIQRYREIHDLVHVLCAVPTTFAGEVAIKWFEYMQTGLESTLLAGSIGTIRTSKMWKFQDSSKAGMGVATTAQSLERIRSHEWEYVWSSYIPWAIQAGINAEFLLNVRFESLMDVDIDQVRSQLNIIKAPASNRITTNND